MMVCARNKLHASCILPIPSIESGIASQLATPDRFLTGQLDKKFETVYEPIASWLAISEHGNMKRVFIFLYYFYFNLVGINQKYMNDYLLE